MSVLARLGSFAAKKRGERCALCAAAIGERHPHLVQIATGKLFCACAGCGSVFDTPAGKFRRVSDRVGRLPDAGMTDGRWHSLGVPVGVAFFQKRSATGTVLAFYPSPLGAVESPVESEAWEALLLETPALRSMEDDVEALLVRRQGAHREQVIAPLDECYALIGIIRREWRGFSGGDAVQPAVDGFFDALRARAEVRR